MIKLENGQVNGLWKSYLPGLVNWVLEMDTNKMREYLLDTYEKVDHLRTVRNSILLTSNNLVEWLQSEVVHSPESIAAVGKKFQQIKTLKKDMSIVIFIYMLVIALIAKTLVQNL